MIEPFVVLVIGFSVGAAAGALSAFLGWNKDEVVFDARKFVTGIITGIIAGVAVVLANTAGLQTAVDESAILIQLVIIVLAILGVDTLRTSITNAIRKSRAQ